MTTTTPQRRSTTKQTSTSTTGSSRYFLIVASRDHVRSAIDGGFCQANHGKKAPLAQMKKGDGVLFYSAKETYMPKSSGLKNKDDVYQRFTAVGTVKDDDVYQVKVTDGFQPYRRNMDFREGKDVSIRPLIEKLDFIRDKTHWGASLRFGFLKIAEGDFEIVEREMVEGKE